MGNKPAVANRLGTVVGQSANTATVVLVTLQLAHVIHWPWWQVFAPTLAALALSVVIVGVAGIVIAIAD